MLQNCKVQVSPANAMWPLFCNRIGLSYRQEECVQHFQHTLLTNHTSWLHCLTASDRTLQDVHLAIAQCKSCILNILTMEQHVKFLVWAARTSAGRDTMLLTVTGSIAAFC
eukprot:13383039-Ditylum_brightwellii.AAC.1